jgi:SprT protein
MIEPISEQQKKHVIIATADRISHAGRLFGRDFEQIDVDFDLKGRCAGMYQVRGRLRRIRFNPWLFAKYFDESVSDTVTHEVAHYIVDCLYGIRRVKPHGVEWQSVMVRLGAVPKATGNYDLSGIPVRQYERVRYSCACRSHELTLLRHNKIIQQGARYRCQYCHHFIVHKEAAG